MPPALHQRQPLSSQFAALALARPSCAAREKLLRDLCACKYATSCSDMHTEPIYGHLIHYSLPE
eukprot:1262585-Pleurochrysis_carterae.AAC.2